MRKQKVINLYGGPGTGKSTTAAAMFAELKYRGINCEYIPEYAKDATWERRGDKIFAAQDYIFGKQRFRMEKISGQVPFLVCDSPILLSLVYIPPSFGLPSLRNVVLEAHNLYDNLDIFLLRNKPFEQAGRNQNEHEARILDHQIRAVLEEHVGKENFYILPFSRMNPKQILDLMFAKGWEDELANKA
jgi:nicotinamide riboside kinase